MKTKFVVVAIVFLLAGALVANAILGNKIAREIDANLKTLIAENELPAEITYAEVKVNPLFSTVEITDVSVLAPNKEVGLNCESLDFDIAYKEALRWSAGEEFEEIKSFKLTMVNAQIKGSDTKAVVKIGDLSVNFDGHLTKADFENLPELFPGEKQSIQLAFSEVEVDLPENGPHIPMLPQLQEQLSTIDAGNYTLVFDPERREISISEFSIESPVISYKGHALFSYTGSGAADFKPKMADMESALKFEPKSFEWGENDEDKGKFELGKLLFTTNSSVSFGSNVFPQGDMNLEIENLAVSSTNSGRPKEGFSLNNLDIKSLKINYHLDKEKLSISDTHIESSLLEAEISADVDVNTQQPANSTIKQATLRVQKLSPDLETLVNGFEQQMGQELPRENGAIVLELSGQVGHPKIKGFDF